MKKLLSLILCLILCLSLFACNSEETQTTEGTKDTQQTEGTKNSTLENTEIEYSFFDVADITLIDSIETFPGFVPEEYINEYDTVFNAETIQEILEYLGSFKLKKAEYVPTICSGAGCRLKFQNENIITVRFEVKNKVDITKNSVTERYEILNEQTVEPREFFKSLGEPIKAPTPSLPEIEKPEYEKTEISIVDGKFALDNKKLKCVFIETSFTEWGSHPKPYKDVLSIERPDHLDKIKNAFLEMTVSSTKPDDFHQNIPQCYHVKLYFDDGTYVYIVILMEGYISNNGIDYYPENKEQLMDVIKTFSWPIS